MSEDNVVFIGSKPLSNYVKGVYTQFNKHNSKEVILRSRGKFISKAVDVAEIIKRSSEEHKVSVKSISISSESFQINERKTNVSSMDIILVRE